MSFQRIRQLRSQHPQISLRQSQPAPHPVPVPEPQRSPTQQDIENTAFNQDKLEALRLQLKSTGSTITPIEQARLGVLQAKMDDFRAQQMEQAKAQPSLVELFLRDAQAAQSTEQTVPVQPKLGMEQPSDRSEQQADHLASPVAEQSHALAPAQSIQGKLVQRQAESDEVLQAKRSRSDLQRSPITPPIQAKGETTGDRSGSDSQQRPNQTGLPDALKTGIESLSGIGLDNVKVHYNSSQPAQLNALAYTQGTDIQVAPGQEQHLPHEAWHVVQQAQGRVKPTMQLRGGVPLNDDKGLEQEADVMGAKALQMQHPDDAPLAPIAKAPQTVQRLTQTAELEENLKQNSESSMAEADSEFDQEAEDSQTTVSQTQPIQRLIIKRANVLDAVGDEGKLKPKHITYQLLKAIQVYEAIVIDDSKQPVTVVNSYKSKGRLVEALQQLQVVCTAWLSKAKSREEKKVNPLLVGKKQALKKTKEWISGAKETIEQLQKEVAQEILDIAIGQEGEAVGYIGEGDDIETVKYVLNKGAGPHKITDMLNTAHGRVAGVRTGDPSRANKYKDLSDEELRAVILYTGQAAYAMNAILRGLLKSKYWDVFRRFLEPAKAGLAKMPRATERNLHKTINALSDDPTQEAYEQAQKTDTVPDLLKPHVLDPKKGVHDQITIDTVYRADYWNPAFEQAFPNRFKVGTTFEEPGFLSTTFVEGSYGGAAPIQMTITGLQSGASVADISQVTVEKEVLLSPGLRFKVTKITLKDARGKDNGDAKVSDCPQPTAKFPKNDKGQEAFNQAGLIWEVTVEALGAPASGGKWKSAASRPARPQNTPPGQ